MKLGLTPSQTVGPFLAIGLPWPDGPEVVAPGTEGAITITGRVLDGAGEPVPDALVETWQAAPDGSFAHPDDPRGGPGESLGGESLGGGDPGRGDLGGGDRPFRAFGRSATGPEGRYRIVTLRPGVLPGRDGGTEAPHLDVTVFARGLLDRVVTRIYFADEEAANATDPVLSHVDPARRGTLIATAQPGGEPGSYRFDIRLQDPQETVFFDV